MKDSPVNAFRIAQIICVVKPIYDLSCEFMYQGCGDIEERRSLFFDNFNLEQEEI